MEKYKVFFNAPIYAWNDTQGGYNLYRTDYKRSLVVEAQNEGEACYKLQESLIRPEIEKLNNENRDLEIREEAGVWKVLTKAKIIKKIDNLKAELKELEG